MAEDVGKYYLGNEYVLDNYDFEHYVGGHVDKVGDKNDVQINKEFTDDLQIAAGLAFSQVNFAEGFTKNFTNNWQVIEWYQVNVAKACVEILETQYNETDWYTTWIGNDVYLFSHCLWATEDIYIDI